MLLEVGVVVVGVGLLGPGVLVSPSDRMGCSLRKKDGILTEFRDRVCLLVVWNCGNTESHA